MKSDGVSGRGSVSNSSSVRSGLGLTCFGCLVALFLLSSSAKAESVAQNAQQADSGLVFFSATSSQTWGGDCSGASCTATSPCAFPTGTEVETTEASCVLVFNAGDYAHALRKVKTSSVTAQLAIALENDVSNLNISVEGSSTVNITSYSYVASSTLQRTIVKSSFFATLDAAILNIHGLSMTNSRFLMSDNSTDTASKDNAFVYAYDSSFDVDSKTAIPSGSSVFDLSLSATPSTRVASLLFKNSTSLNTGGNKDIYLFQSLSVVTGFVSIQEATVTGYGSIVHISATSSSSVIFIHSTLTDIGSLQTPLDTSVGMTLNLLSSTVSRSSFSNDDALTLITRGIGKAIIQSSTLNYVSIYCQDDSVNQIAMTSFQLESSNLYDSDFCLISDGENDAVSLMHVTVTQSEASASFKRLPNVTFSNIYIQSDVFTFNAHTAARTPFVLQGQVTFSPTSKMTSNSLWIADGGYVAVPWLTLTPGAYHLGSNATLTATPVTAPGANIWNFTLPVLTGDDSAGTLDLTNVRLNLILTSTPTAPVIGTSKTLLKTSADIPELMRRMRIQWFGTEAPNAKTLYKIGSFILANVTSAQQAYPSGRFGYYDTDPYRFQGSFAPSAPNSWLTFDFFASLPQACLLPGPTFVSSNTTLSNFTCNNATGQWIYDGHLNTTSDDLSIPCTGCMLLVLGNFTFGSNQLYLQGVYSVLKAAEHIDFESPTTKAITLITYTIDQAPASKWKSGFLRAGFDSPQMSTIDVRLDPINKGCKFLRLKSTFNNPIMTGEFYTQNDCIIPIAVGVSLGLASILAIVLTVVCCCCCKEQRTNKKKGYKNI